MKSKDPTGAPRPLRKLHGEHLALATPVLALLLVLPLLRHGPSCGHDFGFHMQSWMDAGEQIRHGVLFPQWAFSPAFNAGEPRFVFYPPMSWLLGSLLLLRLPANLVPAAFTWVVLTLAGLAGYALARRFTSPNGALLAATAYLANPYLLFTAFERTAYAELLAAAWLPWLLRELLAPQPRVLPLAAPLALLWPSNAPAAVMGTYTLALVLLVRLLLRTSKQVRSDPRWLGLDARLAGSGLAGLVLGLALASFYLVPAALERRYVQIAMAIIPNMRVEDNFLFGHTGYGPHDAVLHTASLVAVSLLGLSAAALAAAWWRRDRDLLAGSDEGREPLRALIALAAAIALLLKPFSSPLWHHLPELAFLQFPWRWMSVLGCVFAAAVALAMGRSRLHIIPVLAGSLLICALAGPLALRPFREGCEAHELPAERVALFQTRHGVGPTDEYTPGDADNDQLRWDDPAWWLATTSTAPGPGTVPNPAATIVDYDELPPLEQTISGQPPRDLTLHLATPQFLVLNLRDYPAWDVAVNGHAAPHLQRDDGLLALALPAGTDTLRIRWRRLPDVWLGDAMSLGALVVAASVAFRSRRIRA